MLLRLLVYFSFHANALNLIEGRHLGHPVYTPHVGIRGWSNVRG